MGIVISIGLLTYINIAKDAEPDIDIPLIYIGVAHQGISPEDAERLIVKPLENQLKTIEGLEDMMATAVNGFGSVMLEFDIKFDKDNTWRCFEFPNAKPLVGWEEVEVQHQH